jgi:hypothetical protein
MTQKSCLPLSDIRKELRKKLVVEYFTTDSIDITTIAPHWNMITVTRILNHTVSAETNNGLPIVPDFDETLRTATKRGLSLAEGGSFDKAKESPSLAAEALEKFLVEENNNLAVARSMLLLCRSG